MAQTLDQLVIELRADIRGLQASLNTADGNLRKFGSRAEQEASRIDAAFARAGKAIAGYFTAQALFNFSRAAVDTAIRMESLQAKMVAATGSSDAAASSMAFLRAESERLGMNFMSAADGFGSFAAAATRAGISMTDVKQVFQGVSEAATALQLSPERVSLTFMALSQIAAKGVVSMEELRQQLGEQLPIAFDAAARAMGVSQARLVEMVSKGEVTAQEFLPKFGRAIRENLGEAVAKASQTALAQTNRLTNAINDLQVKMAGGKAMQSYTSAVQNMARAISDPDVQDGLAAIASGIGYITEIAVVGIATIARWAATLVSEVGKAEAHVRASGYSDRPSMQGLGMSGRRAAATQAGPMNTGSGPLASADGLLGALGAVPAMGGGSEGVAAKGGKGGKDDKQGLRDRVETLKYQLASETEQLAMEYEKRQELLKEALEKKAITEQEYRDLKLEAELDYKNRFGELWAEEAQQRVQLEEEAQNAILSNRRNMYSALTGLMSQFGGRSKAFAIAAIAVEKAQAMQSVLIESRKSAMAARAWAMAMGGPAAAEAAFAREIMMGQVTAAMIAATGLAQAFGGGGSGGEASDGGGGVSSSGVGGMNAMNNADTPARAQSKNIFINIEGDYFGPEHARKLVNSLNEFMGDGSIKLNVTEARYA